MAGAVSQERWTALLAIAALTMAGAARRAGVESPLLRSTLVDLANDDLSEREAGVELNNYYEGLLRKPPGGHRGRRASAGGPCLLPPRNGIDYAEDAHKIGLKQPVSDIRGFELLPSSSALFHGVELRTNRWGLRGDEWSPHKPPGVFRIAACGASNEMGLGVAYEHSMLHYFERRLNAELSPITRLRYEVLNFCVFGYRLPENVYVVERLMPAFHPDLILVSTSFRDSGAPLIEFLARRTYRGQDLYLDELRTLAGKVLDGPGAETIGRLSLRWLRRQDAVYAALFGELASFSRESGIPVVVMAIRHNVRKRYESLEQLAVRAERHGLPTVRLFDALEGQSPYEMYQDGRDHHTTPTGHRRFADELFDDLLAHPGIRPLLAEGASNPSESGTGPVQVPTAAQPVDHADGDGHPLGRGR
ncbi:MAG: hypothetical protein HRF43_05435 [Phycisphaerae bacterium]|jgi:hypothetical protein